MPQHPCIWSGGSLARCDGVVWMEARGGQFTDQDFWRQVFDLGASEGGSCRILTFVIGSSSGSEC